MEKFETTLLYLKDGNNYNEVVMRIGFAKDKYNGAGGKIEYAETPEEAMIRESQEEIDITPIDYEKVGTIKYDEYYKGKREKILVHVFISTKWNGEPKESEEMSPKWFNINNLPYEEMIGDDPYWLPIVLKGKKVNAFFKFDEDWKIVNYKVDIKED